MRPYGRPRQRRCGQRSAHDEGGMEGVLQLVMNGVAGIQNRRQVNNISNWYHWDRVCPTLQRYPARLQTGAMH